ncbi:hypothetical protein CSUI_001799 [Cystoisospora suis]|uniref:Uncharacterized protein n=1 Tax=Cystoisospora suis TaxID=483139 RepID=A0A2C6LBN6_9APIC|nr:hypothetical protein CSUI_001799 [Cystoisospora suis]
MRRSSFLRLLQQAGKEFVLFFSFGAREKKRTRDLRRREGKAFLLPFFFLFVSSAESDTLRPLLNFVQLSSSSSPQLLLLLSLHRRFFWTSFSLCVSSLKQSNGNSLLSWSSALPPSESRFSRPSLPSLLFCLLLSPRLLFFSSFLLPSSASSLSRWKRKLYGRLQYPRRLLFSVPLRRFFCGFLLTTQEEYIHKDKHFFFRLQACRQIEDSYQVFLALVFVSLLSFLKDLSSSFCTSFSLFFRSSSPSQFVVETQQLAPFVCRERTRVI